MEYFLDNQIGTFDRSSDQGIRRHFRDLYRYQKEISSVAVNAPLLSRSGSGIREISKPFREFGFRSPSAGMFRANRLESLVRTSKSTTVLIPTFYFQDYLDIYLSQKRRLLLPIHDMIPEVESGQYPDLRDSHKAKHAYAQAAEVIYCPSHTTAQHIAGIYGQDYLEKTIVVPHYLPKTELNLPSRFQYEEYLLKLDSKSEQNPLHILYIGYRAHYKRFQLIEELVMSSPVPIILSVIGGGLPTSVEIMNARKLANVGSRIEYLGNVPEEEKRNLLMNVDIVAFPTKIEGFGYPVFEAISHGKMVIVQANSMWTAVPSVVELEDWSYGALREKILKFVMGGFQSRLDAIEEYFCESRNSTKHGWQKVTEALA